MVSLAVIGGSGLYSLLDDARVSRAEGASSDISVGRMGSREVAFLARHGNRHTIPPHRVPYKANIEALSNMGVERIIATNAVGSLRPDYKPGDFVLFDQFVNATHGREDTFFHGPKVTHVSMADPYCSELRSIAVESAGTLGMPLHEKATIVVINGPRFSTRAESRLYSSYADVIGMTQYPEVALAREKGMCYLGIGMVTDYDAGLEGREDVKPVSYDEVGRLFRGNVERMKALISEVVAALPEGRHCTCSKSLEGAEVSV